MTTTFHIDPNDTRWSRGLNAIEMAGRIGMETNHSHTGGQIFTALEVTFICRAVRHDRFKRADRKPPRLKQNLLVIWTAGLGKSYSGDMFYEECVGAVPASSNAPRNRPRLINNSGSMTFAKMRGGANSRGDPILPALLYADFMNITEMSAVFGEYPRIDYQMLRQFGVLAEEGYMEVSFQKFDDMSVEEAEEFAEKTKHIKGFHFTVEPRGFRFDSPAVYTMFTTNMSDDERDVLKRIGFWSRFDVHQINISEEEEARLLREFNPNAKMTVRTEDLRAVNDDIWNTKFCEIPWPPSDLMLNYAQRTIVEEIVSLAADARSRPAQFANYRDIGNIARIMAAHAISRIFVDRKRGDRSPVESIEYTKEDADFAIQYFRPHLNQLRMAPERSPFSEWKDVPDSAHETLIQLVTDVNKKFNGVEAGELGTEAFFVTAGRRKVSRKTAQNWLAMLTKAGIITKGRGAKTFQVHEDYLRERVFPEPPIVLIPVMNAEDDDEPGREEPERLSGMYEVPEPMEDE